jgi:hypothetical protein
VNSAPETELSCLTLIALDARRRSQFFFPGPSCHTRESSTLHTLLHTLGLTPRDAFYYILKKKKKIRVRAAAAA